MKTLSSIIISALFGISVAITSYLIIDIKAGFFLGIVSCIIMLVSLTREEKAYNQTGFPKEII